MKEFEPPNGGAFLIEERAPDQISIPEDLPAEAHLMAHTADRFMRQECVPLRERLEAHEDDVMRALLRYAGDLGLLCAGIPKEYGGLGLARTWQAILTEKLGSDLSFAITAGVHGGVALLPLLIYGTPEQKTRWLPKLASGTMIAAFALSEANSGSDALSARASATLAPDGAHYLLRGVKSWVTNAGFADLITVFAKVDTDEAEEYGDAAEPRPRGSVNGKPMTAFLVERNFPGVSFGPEERKLGLRGSSTRQMFLDDVPVPITHVLGPVGQGHKVALSALNLGRLNIGVCALGASKTILGEAVQYAKQRRQFGRSIGEFGLIRHKLGEMAVRIALLESMVYRTAGYFDRRVSQIDSSLPDADARLQAICEEYAIECALVKFFGTEVLDYVGDEGLQIHGGYGYCENFLIARAYRDARVFRIFEGTNEVNRLSVMDQLRRRIRNGRLVLGGFDETRQPIEESEAANDVSHQCADRVRNIRRTVLFTLEQAWAAQDSSGVVLQETNAACADMAAALYALESLWLRGCKLASNGNSASGLMRLAMQSAGFDACVQVEQSAVYALASVGSGDELSRNVQMVRNLFGGLPALDTAGLRRAIALEVLEADGYPWGA